jgi:hypothetical protein
MKKISILILSIGVILLTTNAFSSTMTFDSLALGTVITTYTEDGLTAEVLWTSIPGWPSISNNFSLDGKAMHSEGAFIKFYMDNGSRFNLDQIFFDSLDGGNSYIQFSNGTWDSLPGPWVTDLLIDYTSDSDAHNLTYFAIHLPDEGFCSQIDYINVSQVPIPTAILLLVPGFIGLAGLRKNLKK